VLFVGGPAEGSVDLGGCFDDAGPFQVTKPRGRAPAPGRTLSGTFAPPPGRSSDGTYQAILKGKPVGRRFELAKDVAAFANGSGGTILLEATEDLCRTREGSAIAVDRR